MSCSQPSASMVRNRSLPPAATFETASMLLPYLYRLTAQSSDPLARTLCTLDVLSPASGTSGRVVSVLIPCSNRPPRAFVSGSSRSSQNTFGCHAGNASSAGLGRPARRGMKWKCSPSTSCACGGLEVAASPYPNRVGYSSTNLSTNACLPMPAGPQSAMIRGGGCSGIHRSRKNTVGSAFLALCGTRAGAFESVSACNSRS